MLYSDTEQAVRLYLRDTTMDEVSGRVFFGMDKSTNTFPLVTVYAVGGTKDSSDAPIENVRISVDSWGKTKISASNVIRAAAQSMCEINNEFLDDSTYCYYAEVGIPRWLPDEEEGALAHYQFDVELICRAA